MIDLSEKLYFYNRYIHCIQNLFFNKKLPSSIMFFGKEGIGKKNFIAHLLLDIQNKTFLNNQSLNNENFIFHNQDDLNNIVQNKNSNVKFVYNSENTSNITIDQIREIINYTQQSSLNGESKFIIICNAENLNLFAANSLLKILENPPENNYFILIADTGRQLINTIKSRCVKFKIEFSKNERSNILSSLLNDLNLNNSSIVNDQESPGSIINKLKFIMKNNLNNKNVLEVIDFCLNDYKENKNKSSLKIAFDLLSNFFYEKMLINFKSTNNIYNIFKKKMINTITFNSDIEAMINFLKIGFK